MKVVRRNKYMQVGKTAYGKWYPSMMFPRDFKQRWAKPKAFKPGFRTMDYRDFRNTVLKPASFVDMILESARPMKRKFRGMLRLKRGSSFKVMHSATQRKGSKIDPHRIR